ncbi:MAG TPA: tyrosine-type recombinase/integrase [Desulfitobacteriaceae bacterium]|nr:tyrosine-type recombinase/integrase [Desulfitobacteriaceae bacterium]
MEFKTVYMPSRNFAPRTREEYLNDLEDLLRFLDQVRIEKVNELSISVIDRYLAHLDDRSLAGATRKRKVIAIRGFLTFLYRNQYLTNDISKGVIPPFSEYPLPRVFTQTEYQRLLEACASNVRDLAIIQLLLQTGIRLSELVNLTRENIDLPADDTNPIGTLKIISGGGRKSREIPINSTACQAIQKYLISRPEVSSNLVFLNNTGQPLGERGVQKVVLKYMTKIHLHGASVQTLRHTFAAQHLAKGTSIKTIQLMLGHKDIRTTEIYLPLAKEIIRKQVEENAL